MTMKKILLVSYFFVSISVFGQSVKLSPSDTSYFSLETESLKFELPDGKYEVYYDQSKSKIHYRGQILNHQRDGVWELFNDSNALIHKVFYVEGVLNGDMVEYYSNGQKRRQVMIKNGSPEGIMVEWWENEQKKAEGEYLNGAKSGLWKFWDGNGNLTKECEFKKGIEVEL